jgi:CRISPR-associated endonuclease/helicase Cas3
LLPSHLDRWVQTYPYPDSDPAVALWLHGMAESSADVNLVWRADLTEGLLTQQDSQPAVDLVTACRPGSGEAMSVPIRAAQAWLARPANGDPGTRSAEVADIEGTALNTSADGRVPGGAEIRPVLRWRGDQSDVARHARDIKPGDTLVVPATYGGIKGRNWAPPEDDLVIDLGHRVEAEQRLRATLRLHPAVLSGEAEFLPALPFPAAADAEPDVDDQTVIDDWLAMARTTSTNDDDPTSRIISALLADPRRIVTRVRAERLPDLPSTAIFVVTSKRPLPYPTGPGESVEDSLDGEPETSSFTGVPIALIKHLGDVEQWARKLAEACGLSPELTCDLALAGRLHDIGKADPRFQMMLRNGRITDEGLLAKSDVMASERAERDRARREAGYPRQGRHELLSVAMAQRSPVLAASASDWELVLYLVATHHGYCRPFAPVVHDPHPCHAFVDLGELQLDHSTATGMARIDSGIADRFWILVRRYGWFGLAWLECILRLADHRASAAEQVAESSAKVTQ